MGWYRTEVLGNRLLFTDRRGGLSAPPFDSLNLALTLDGGPPAEETRENRRRATRALLGGDEHPDWVPMRQVHGSSVVVDAATAVLTPEAPAPEGDAVVVTERGKIGAVIVADCAPIALVGRGAAAAVHAGWRGLLAGVVERSVEAMRLAGTEPAYAFVGPSIHPCCYEFGEEDLRALEERFGPEVRGATADSALALDVPAAARSALRACGIARVVEIDICTACSPDYFSHRRDGRTGRQGLLVARRA